MSNLDSESLRVEPLGHDRKNSAYWYFYGTRLYREDYVESGSDGINERPKVKPKERKRKRRRGRAGKTVEEEEEEEEEKEEDSLVNVYGDTKERETVWQVVCFTQQDWCRLVDKFRDSVRKSPFFWMGVKIWNDEM